MRLRRWEKILLLAPLAAASVAAILYLVQGGFGGGRDRFFVFPSVISVYSVTFCSI